MFKNYLTLIVLLFITISLSGCGLFKTKEVIVYKTNTVVIEVPDYLLTYPLVESPPEKEKYKNSTMEEKEDILTDYIISLFRSLTNYKTRIDGIKKHIETEKNNILKKEKET